MIAALTLTGAEHPEGADALQVRALSIKKRTNEGYVDLDADSATGLIKTRAGQPYSLQHFDDDLKRLSRIYDRVEPQVTRTAQGIEITLYVASKPTVSAIRWSGNKRFASAKLNRELGIKPNELFSSQAFAKALHNIRALYLKNGYYETEVNLTTKDIDSGGRVEVEIAIAEGKRGYIRKVHLDGLTPEEQKQFWLFALSKPYRAILSEITRGGRYQPDMAERDEFFLVDFLQNLGYSDASVKVEVLEAPKRDYIDLKFSANKGSLYRVGKINLSGQKLFTEEELRKRLKIREGDPLSPVNVQLSIQALTALYGERGYIDAEIDPIIDMRDEDVLVQDIALQINEGQRSRVGLVKIRGNRVTQSRVILHEVHLVPGQVLDQRKLRASEQRLENTDLFENVQIIVAKSTDFKGPTSDDSQYRDILIEVTEKGTGKINFSLGMSNEERGFLGFGISEENFNIQGLSKIRERGIGAIRGGGQNVALETHLSRSMRNLNLSWTEPHWRDTPWTVGVDLDYANNINRRKHYRTYWRGISLFASYPLNAYTYFNVKHKLKHTRSKATPEASLRLRENARNSGVISAFGVGLHYRSTESIMKPRSGFVSKADVEIAGLGGNFQFLNWGYQNSYYVPLNERGTLKLTGNLNLIQPYGSTTYERLPLSERLYLGGEYSIRGYRQDHVGPKFEEDRIDPATSRRALIHDEPRGGLSSLLLSAEYLHNLGSIGVGGFDGFVFVDAGKITDRAYNLGSPWVSTYGFGIRVDLAQRIPLILGLGYPLKKPRDGRADTQKFFFALGGTF